MIEQMEQADPAAGVVIDKASLRATVEELIDGAPRGAQPDTRRRLVAAFAAMAMAATALLVLQPSPPVDALPLSTPTLGDLGRLHGIEAVVTLEMGGVKTMAVDGDTIWVVEALHRRLDRVDAERGSIVATYEIDAYVEGVVPGGEHLWLLSYDDGGEVLRFDPSAGRIDKRIPLGGEPWFGAAWFGDRLWVSNDQGQLVQISAAGEILSTSSGELKGEGFGYLWVNDPATGLISSHSADGTIGEFVIPTVTGGETADGWGVRGVAEAGELLFLMDGSYPWGTNLSTFDPVTGDFRSFASLTFGLLDMVWFDDALWVTSHTDHLLMRVDSSTGEVRRFPMPGKAGGLAVADDSLWVNLYHPGALLRLDTTGLLEAGPIVADDWNRFPHRLLCTGPEGSSRPTVIIEPYDWIDYGSWSVIQAQLNQEGYVACVNGYVDGEASPQERAAALEDGLAAYGMTGPYVLVAAGDGVHPLRIFADGRDDLAGVVLVDPTPVGFGDFLDTVIDEAGHTSWADLAPELSDSLDDLGDVPLTVIGQDPEAVFLSQRALEGFGKAQAEAINDFWQDGLAFYSGLSTDVVSVVADGTGMHLVVWDRPDLVTGAVLEVLTRR